MGADFGVNHFETVNQAKDMGEVSEQLRDTARKVYDVRYDLQGVTKWSLASTPRVFSEPYKDATLDMGKRLYETMHKLIAFREVFEQVCQNIKQVEDLSEEDLNRLAAAIPDVEVGRTPDDTGKNSYIPITTTPVPPDPHS